MGIYVFVIAVILFLVVRLVSGVRQKRHAQEQAASVVRKPKKTKRKAAAPAVTQSVAPLSEVMAAHETAAVPPAAREKFPESLSYLPSLKRAVIMAEILGKPKGLE